MTPRRGEKKRDLRVSASQRPRIRLITLLTDFGLADYFVGALKGVILSINPSVSIIDLTHEIPPQDVAAGAFTLMASYQSFPSQTVHVAVVDPGVGSDRRPILVWAGSQLFCGTGQWDLQLHLRKRDRAQNLSSNQREVFSSSG